jgi:hypothetical protein
MGTIRHNVNIIAQEKKKSKNFFENKLDFLMKAKSRIPKGKKSL